MASKKYKRNQKTTTQSKQKQPTNNQNFVKKEVAIITTLAVGIFLTLSNFGICGKMGDIVSGFMFGFFGVIAYILPILLFVAVAFCASNKGNKRAEVKMIAVGILLLMLCILLEVIVYGTHESLKFSDYYKEHMRCYKDHRDKKGETEWNML